MVGTVLLSTRCNRLLLHRAQFPLSASVLVSGLGKCLAIRPGRAFWLLVASRGQAKARGGAMTATFPRQDHQDQQASELLPFAKTQAKEDCTGSRCRLAFRQRAGGCSRWHPCPASRKEGKGLTARLWSWERYSAVPVCTSPGGSGISTARSESPVQSFAARLARVPAVRSGIRKTGQSGTGHRLSYPHDSTFGAVRTPGSVDQAPGYRTNIQRLVHSEPCLTSSGLLMVGAG
jgi:hypothetical protein